MLNNLQHYAQSVRKISRKLNSQKEKKQEERKTSLFVGTNNIK
jgi:hypothetical protein